MALSSFPENITVVIGADWLAAAPFVEDDVFVLSIAESGSYWKSYSVTGSMTLTEGNPLWITFSFNDGSATDSIVASGFVFDKYGSYGGYLFAFREKNLTTHDYAFKDLFSGTPAYEVFQAVFFGTGTSYNPGVFKMMYASTGAVANEEVVLADGVTCAGTLLETVAESFSLVDVAPYEDAISDAIDVADAQAVSLIGNETTADAIASTDSAGGNIAAVGNIADSISVTDTTLIKWLEAIAEALAVDDESSNSLGLLIAEILSIIDAQVNNWDGAEAITDSVSVLDSPVLIKRFADIVEVALGIVDASTWKLVLQIIEALGLLDSQVTNWQGSLSVNSGVGLIDDPRVIKILNDVVEEAITVEDALEDLFRILVSEALSLVDSQMNNWNGRNIITEAISMLDSAALVKIFSDVIDESVTVEDAATEVWRLFINEILSIIDSQLNNWNGRNIISDALAIVDISTIAGLISDTIEEGISIEDAVEKIFLGLFINEVLSLVDVQMNNWNGANILADNITVRETFVSLIKTVFDSIDDGVSFEDAISPIMGLLIADVISCSSTATAIGQFARQISDQMSLADDAIGVWAQLIEEVIAITEATLAVNYMYDTLAEAVQAVDAGSALLTVPRTVTESITFVPVLSVLAVLASTISDILTLAVTVELDGGVWECWVLNTNEFHPSIYTNFNFNSYAMYQGALYGCKNDGIYELTGTTDDEVAISTRVIFPRTDFGSSMSKRFRRAWLGITGASPALKVETEDGNTETYLLDNDKTTISRGMAGKKWTFTVNNFDSLDFIELMPIVLKRY